jgi:hypothetical protein
MQAGAMVIDGRTWQLQRRGIENYFDPMRDTKPEFGIDRLKAKC